MPYPRGYAGSKEPVSFLQKHPEGGKTYGDIALASRVDELLYENAVLMWEQRSCAATAQIKLVAAAARRSAPTLPPRPPFSSAVVLRTEAWRTFFILK